jgi:molecular chaperone IbpA
MSNREIKIHSLDIPALHRFGIGFDSTIQELLRLTNQQSAANYPPHNVIKTGDETVIIQIAVAGFYEGEIELTLNGRLLTVTGTNNREDDVSWEYYHRGISSRNFTREFTLAEHVEITNAVVTNGILNIYLERKVPEEKKPKQIAINYAK